MSRAVPNERSPFGPRGATLDFDRDGHGAWTAEEYAAIREEFSRRRLNGQRQAVDDFLVHASMARVMFATQQTVRSRAEQAETLQELERATRAMLKALTHLAMGDGFADYLRTFQRLQRAEHGARAAARVRQGLEAHWKTTLLVLRAAEATRKETRGDRGSRQRDRRARLLVSYLKARWREAFGKSPALTRDGEFHRVAAAIGKALGIPVGRRTLSG